VIRHRDGGTSRRSDAGTAPESIPEIGRNLRRARTRQGLTLDDVSGRAGLAVSQLDALESGTADRIPDRVIVLKTLRRYADALGLPGDRYVLSMVEHWPAATVPPGASPTVAIQQTPAGTRVPVKTATPSPVDTGAIPVTSAVRPPRVEEPASSVSSGTGASVPSSAQVNLLVDTGVTPAVGPAPVRKPKAPLLLKVVVAVVFLAVIVGVAGLVIHRYEPKWLNSLGITHAHNSAGHHHTTTTAVPAVFTVASTSATGATFHIRAPSFLIRVEPVGTASWMQATDGQHVSPIFAGVVGAGQVKDFLGLQSFTLEVGSPTAHVFISVGNKVVGFYFPPAAPFTMQFDSVS